MGNINDIITSLRKLYPKLHILIWEKDGKSQLIVNDKIIFRYETDFLNKQLQKSDDNLSKEIVKIWAEYIEIRYVQRINKFNKKTVGRQSIGLTIPQIKFAIINSKSAADAARFLHVSYSTFRKYAEMYNLLDDSKNQKGKGIRKGGLNSIVPLEDIFANKHPNYKIQRLKNRLLSEMVFEEKCSVCGYSEKRVFDGKICLVLDFIDGNSKNRELSNLRLICLNCRFNIRGRLSQRTLDQLDKEYNQGLIIEEEKKINSVWSEFNTVNNSTDIIQTNNNEIDNDNDNVDDIWSKFNG